MPRRLDREGPFAGFAVRSNRDFLGAESVADVLRIVKMMRQRGDQNISVMKNADPPFPGVGYSSLDLFEKEWRVSFDDEDSNI